MSREIDSVIAEFVQKDAMFTSIDVANLVKLRGVFLRNSEVASYLRNTLYRIAPNYTVSFINVVRGEDNAPVMARLYHPVGADTDSYVNTAQKALTPDDFAILNKNKVVSAPTVDATVDAAAASAGLVNFGFNIPGAN